MSGEAVDRFHQFALSLAGLAGDEARKAKLLFIRNELADLEKHNEDARAIGWVQLVFAIIPPFWPILYAQRMSLVNAARQRHRRLHNALVVWKDDLGDDAAPLASELERLREQSPRLLPWGAQKPGRRLDGA